MIKAFKPQRLLVDKPPYPLSTATISVDNAVAGHPEAGAELSG
jgi:hypothetical protein